MAKIVGMEGLTDDDVRRELENGAKFVLFPWVVSALVVTFRRSSDIHFIRSGEWTLGRALPYILISLFFGWWGIPFGLIYTPTAIIQNLSGGKDVTANIVSALTAPARAVS